MTQITLFMKDLTKRTIATVVVFVLAFTPALPLSTSIALAGGDSSQPVEQVGTGQPVPVISVTQPAAPLAPVQPQPSQPNPSDPRFIGTEPSVHITHLDDEVTTTASQYADPNRGPGTLTWNVDTGNGKLELADGTVQYYTGVELGRNLEMGIATPLDYFSRHESEGLKLLGTGLYGRDTNECLSVSIPSCQRFNIWAKPLQVNPQLNPQPSPTPAPAPTSVALGDPTPPTSGMLQLWKGTLYLDVDQPDGLGIRNPQYKVLNPDAFQSYVNQRVTVTYKKCLNCERLNGITPDGSVWIDNVQLQVPTPTPAPQPQTLSTASSPRPATRNIVSLLQRTIRVLAQRIASEPSAKKRQPLIRIRGRIVKLLALKQKQ